MKGDWQYIYSKSLQQKVALDRNSGWVFCEDGTRYSPAELARITKNWTASPELPLAVHLIKKNFDGEIIAAGIEKKHYAKN